MHRAARILGVVVFGFSLIAACDPDLSAQTGASSSEPASPGASSGGPGAPGAMPGNASSSSGDVDQPPTGPCMTTFRVKAPSASSVVIAGEWDGFGLSAKAEGPDTSGNFIAKLELKPGFYGYKLVVDNEWKIDPVAHERKYLGGTENSAVRVTNCDAPVMAAIEHSQARPAVGEGSYHAKVELQKRGRAITPASAKAVLRREDVRRDVAATIEGNSITVDVADLADGKYSLFVEATDAEGVRAEPVRHVFWIEQAPFEWQDSLIYMAMIDRFEDGTPANNPPKTAGVDPRADYYGGDLEGLRKRIADGTFDKLGVRALWLSPFQTNPNGAWDADTPGYKAMGYHGYWPVKAREVDRRIGGDAALVALVKEAHAHGIRILQDFVINHVHIEHEYMTSHPEWFRTGCVCGTNACDWTEKRLECLFSNYMPDVNWSVPEASEQFSADAVWWLDNFDMDGLRVDAVKHVEDAAVMNLSTRVRDTFEAAGTRVFLTGETAMGWSDCGLDCNKDQYGTISRYIGPYMLDGQFDFVLHHAVPYRAFAYGEKGMLHTDYWSQQSISQYPAGAIMTPYIGSHDTPRFTTLATYRGQNASYDKGIAGQKWDSTAKAPPDKEPYQRHRLALAWLLTQPGAPLLYSGDEYGEWGGGDPNNRVMWRGASASLTDEEKITLEFTKKLGAARRNLSPLRRGGYVPLMANEDDLAYARREASNSVLVAFTRRAEGGTMNIDVSSLGFAEGTELKDALGGGNVRVQGGNVTVTLGARGAVILSP